jgi:amphi-Trp domain-containing protein
MTEETLFKSEEKVSRQEAVDRIRSIADRIESGEVELSSGSESVRVVPGEKVEFEVKVEEESGSGGKETSLELELEWNDNGSSDLEIG